MKKRYFKKKEKNLPKGYDSGLEYLLHQTILEGFDREPFKLDYTVDHTYTVDFVHPEHKKFLIECKGRFQDTQAASIYKHVRECNPEYEIIFIFEKPETPMPFAKVRKKCGTKLNHGQWATKNKFRWFTKDTFPGVDKL